MSDLSSFIHTFVTDLRADIAGALRAINDHGAGAVDGARGTLNTIDKKLSDFHFRTTGGAQNVPGTAAYAAAHPGAASPPAPIAPAPGAVGSAPVAASIVTPAPAVAAAIVQTPPKQ